MRKLFISIICLLALQTTFAQEWHSINSKSDESYSVNLIKSTDDAVVLDLSINGFYTKPVLNVSSTSVVVTNQDMAPLAEVGHPDIPSLSIPIIINDNAKMDIRIKDAKYVDYENVDIAPSRGDFPRSVNPDDVPYIYADVYQQDAFLPISQAKLDSPYILRDFRAQNIIVTPFAYNAVTKTLRVYHEMTIEVVSTKEEGENVLTRRSDMIEMDSEFGNMYKQRFVNYKDSAAKYDVVDEEGDLLIICHDAYMEAMQPFVNWKKSIGRKTTMVGTSVAGTNADDIKSYVSAQYDDNPDLTHLLLVGDFAHIPGKYMNATGYAGYSDWWYGQLEGNDYYNELIVGRFSAESVADVTTQVNKVIHYERDINADDTWLTVGQGVSKRENQYGHNNEDDYQHIDNIRQDLLDYNYTAVHRDYSNVTGVTSSAAIVSEHINAGVSIINYCNHGFPTGWGVFNYSNSHVNALTNDNMLPYIISTACNNGEYTYYSQPCFAETWLRATNSTTGEPTGAVGGMFSYISQPWVPPMYGQDEMVDILVESYADNIKRTMGGVSMHGNMKILDISQNSPSYYGTYNTWILFGDPTLTLRNDVPQTMNVTHNDEMSEYSTSFAVNVSNAEGARVTLSKDNEILSTALVNNGNATLNFIPPMSDGQAVLTVFDYNKITYQSTIDVLESDEEMIVVVIEANKDVVEAGASVMLTATAYGASGNYSYSWTPTEGVTGTTMPNPIVTPQTTTTYTCIVTDGEISGSGSITIVAVTPPTNLDAKVNGLDVELSWDATVTDAVYNVYREGVKIASNIETTSFMDEGLSEGYYNYEVTSVYDDIESAKSNVVSAVVMELKVTTYANPGFIGEGESTTIMATATGVDGTETYSWTPAESLENPNASVTEAIPERTTTYTVTVTCGSQTVSATVLVEVLIHPENVVATVDGNDVTIEWEAVPEAEHYRVYCDGDVVASYEPTTSFTDRNVSYGNHCYTVQSVNDLTFSLDSEEVCVDVEACEPPKNVTAEPYYYDGEFGALIDWDRMESTLQLTEYRIYRSDDNEEYKLIQTLVDVPGMNHFQFSDMHNLVGTFYYKVSAYYASIDCESEFGQADGSTDDFVVVDVTSLNENDNENVAIYPNPVKDKLYVKASQINSVTIVNMMGQVVMRLDVNSDETSIDMSSLESGIYLMNIETEYRIITRQINVIK